MGEKAVWDAVRAVCFNVTSQGGAGPMVGCCEFMWIAPSFVDGVG